MYHGDFGLGVGDGAVAIFEESGSAFGVGGLWLHPAHNRIRIRIQDDMFFIYLPSTPIGAQECSSIFLALPNFFVGGAHPFVQ